MKIKIIDPAIAKEDEAIKRDQDTELNRILKNPTAKDKLEANKERSLLKKDNVTEKIKQQQKELIRFYKFKHPEKGIMLYGSVLITEDMPAEIRKFEGEWISREEYNSQTHEHYSEMKGKSDIKIVNSILDIDIVRNTPEFEKKIRARG